MKKIARSLVIALFLVFALNSVAYACDNNDRYSAPNGLQILTVQVQIGDAMIYGAIKQAQFRASLPGANIDRIVDDLTAFTEGITSNLDMLAERVDVTLMHDYITVNIGGQDVTVDPSRVPGV